MKKLTKLTKRDIVDIIMSGMTFYREKITYDYMEREIIENEPYEAKIYYYGKLTEIDFLSRLYTLEELPSKDFRYKNANADIWQHRVNNDDWDENWVFYDDRFGLLNGEDELFLNFLCEMFNPFVRDEKTSWQEFLNTFNELLRQDGYEFYEKNHISGRAIYGWKETDSIELVTLSQSTNPSDLKLLGGGSYADVYRFKDPNFDKWYVLKRAKKDLDAKEITRFENEFLEMNKLKSPYIVEVYNFNKDKKEYTMECMDSTLYDYIRTNNNKLNTKERYKIAIQLFNAFNYINNKGILHRDISFTNVLLKLYDDVTVLKISDFGLIKTKESNLTSIDSEVKGSLNDPQLEITGFKNYEIRHETFALTRVVYFIMTGKSKISDFDNERFKSFIEKGINKEITGRYNSVEEMKKSFISCFSK